MSVKKTHREIKNPQITGRYLADYMAASERRHSLNYATLDGAKKDGERWAAEFDEFVD